MGWWDRFKKRLGSKGDGDELEEKLFLAVLSGVVARYGCMDSEGKLSTSLVPQARELVKAIKEDM
jgi:hypothetical protein